MNIDYNKRHQERIEKAQNICTYLSKYNASICKYDRTAVIVSDITERKLEQLCKELQCSGIYLESTQSGILTNFGMYK